MQALVRVQARVRARRVRMSIEGQAVQRLLDERQGKNEVLKQAEVVHSLSKQKRIILTFFTVFLVIGVNLFLNYKMGPRVSHKLFILYFC